MSCCAQIKAVAQVWSSYPYCQGPQRRLFCPYKSHYNISPYYNVFFSFNVFSKLVSFRCYQYWIGRLKDQSSLKSVLKFIPISTKYLNVASLFNAWSHNYTQMLLNSFVCIICCYNMCVKTRSSVNDNGKIYCWGQSKRLELWFTHSAKPLSCRHCDHFKHIQLTTK